MLDSDTELSFSSGVITPERPLILATGSIARQRILARSGLAFSVCVSGVDEAKLKRQFTTEPVAERVRLLAEAKARKVSEQHPHAVVVGSDQICGFGDQLLDKPGTADAAINQLQLLQGQTHQLYGATCFYHQTKRLWWCLTVAHMQMKSLTKAEITRYITLDQPLQACGSYHYEGLGVHLFSAVDGSADAISGLPLQPLLLALQAHGIYRLV